MVDLKYGRLYQPEPVFPFQPVGFLTEQRPLAKAPGWIILSCDGKPVVGEFYEWGMVGFCHDLETLGL